VQPGCICSSSTSSQQYHFDPDQVTCLIGRVNAAGLRVQLVCAPAVTDDASLKRALDTGCARLNLGTPVLRNPAWTASVIAEHGSRPGVSLPVGVTDRGPRLALHGRYADGGDVWPLIELLDEAGCTSYTVTDISAEGALTGPNLTLLRQVTERTDAPVLAAGGIATVEHLSAVAGPGVHGAVVGRALLGGTFTLEQAHQALNQHEPNHRQP